MTTVTALARLQATLRRLLLSKVVMMVVVAAVRSGLHACRCVEIIGHLPVLLTGIAPVEAVDRLAPKGTSVCGPVPCVETSGLGVGVAVAVAQGRAKGHGQREERLQLHDRGLIAGLQLTEQGQ